MMQIVYSPRWFFGKDIIIDAISVIVLLLIAFTAFRYYRIDKKRTYLSLAGGFFLMGFAFICKILMNFTIYYHVFETKNLGFVTLTVQSIRSSDALFFIGFLLFRLLTLLGLYWVFNTYYPQCPKATILNVFLITALTYFSQDVFYVFHITALIILLLISHQILSLSQKSQSKSTTAIAWSFILISLSHLMFCFLHLEPEFYVGAEIVQLIGYIGLLIAFLMVRSHGKTLKNRHHR
jgi:hypothetical protein